MADMSRFRGPTHRFANPAAVVEGFRPPKEVENITFNDKMRLFGDPLDPNFERDNIVAAALPGFGQGKAKEGNILCHRLLAESLQTVFESIQALNLPYYFDPYRDTAESHYCLRYAKTEDNYKALVNRPEYAKCDKSHWNVTFAKADQAAGRGNDLVNGKRKCEHLSAHSWGSALDVNPASNPLGNGKEFDLPYEIVCEMAKFGFYWGGYFQHTGSDFMHFQWGARRSMGRGRIFLGRAWPIPWAPEICTSRPPSISS